MNAPNDLELVRQAAASVGLLDGNGALVAIDSLMMVDLIIAIEEVAHVEIPAERLDNETFTSLESIAAIVRSLRSEQP